MKTKTKGKRGKAIIGIAMAAIMVASVFVALMPMGTARDLGDGTIVTGDTLFAGESGLAFNTTSFLGTIVRLDGQDNGAEGEIITIADASNFYIPTDAVEGVYDVMNDTPDIAGEVTIKQPSITGNVYIAGKVDSIVGESIPVGQPIKIRASPNFGGFIRDANTGEWGNIKIKLIDPDGVETMNTTAAYGARIHWEDIDTTGWDTGEWTVKITSDKDTCNEVDVSSPEYKFRIRSEELEITARKDEVGKGDDIVLTISGNPNRYYYFAIENIVEGEEPMIQATTGVTRNTTSPYNNIVAWVEMSSAGTRDVKINTTKADERTYTMHVFDTFEIVGAEPNAIDWYELPDDVKNEVDDDDVKVKVTEAGVTFDMPTSAVIGEDVTIKGTVSAGDSVDIVIEDTNKVFDDISVDENSEFDEDWETAGLTKGSYTIDVYIDCEVDTKNPEDYEDIDEDGSTSIRLVVGGLDAEHLRNVIAEDDDYTIEGTATGVDDVDIILIGPDGYPPDETSLGVEYGLDILSTSVTDNEFSEDIEMGGAGFDTGRWIALVLAPGRDGEYAALGTPEAGGLKLDSFPDLDGKNQEQILAVIKDNTVDVAGSDDLLVERTFRVESGYVRLDPIASVAVGEPLVISGTTNREPDTRISISTFAGPMDLPTAFADVEWTTASEGVFNATIDTTDVVVGTYTIEADDGDGNTDTKTVEILTEVPATPTPVVEVTATPEVTPTIPPATPTPEPTPTPTPTPGFEAVFAIAGLLAVAYLVQRKRRE